MAISQFADGLPLYCQEQRLKRIGVDLPRSTLATWMVKVGVLAQPVINLMRERMLAYPVLAMDETRMQLLKQPGRRPQSQSYLWVQSGGPPNETVLLYDCDLSRSQEVPKHYRGYLQTDGYSGDDAVCAQNGIAQLGCWAHARRKFDEARKVQTKSKGKTKKQDNTGRAGPPAHPVAVAHRA